MRYQHPLILSYIKKVIKCFFKSKTFSIFVKQLKTHTMIADLQKTAERILDKSFEQIEFLIKNSSEIRNLTNGSVDTSKIDGFRPAMYLVYMAGLNTDVLENVSLSQIEMFLDKGLFNEFMCDQKVFILNVKHNL